MKLLRPSLAALCVAAALSLTACDESDRKEAGGKIGDVLKEQETNYVTSSEVSDFSSLETSNPGVKELRKAGYEPVAIVTDKNGARELIVKDCNGADLKACLNADPTSEKPIVYFPLEGSKGVTPMPKYGLGYAGVGGRHLGVRCDADATGAAGIPGGVVGDFATIGSAVDKQFAKGAALVDQAIKVGNSNLTCDAKA